MIRTPKLFVCIILVLNFACSNENLQLNDNNTGLNNTTDSRPEKVCEINFNNLSSNDVLEIDCELSLNGQSITLPQNIILKFNGGNIKNGTLIFNGGLIDGELLQHDLEITGNVRLSNSTFQFEKEKWNIIEGDVSYEQALENRKNLNKAISLVKSLRGYQFELDNIDAYFEVGAYHFGNYTYREAIQIPSNFHFKMGNNCTLRVQPNDQIAYGLLSARNATNVKISGGHLIGDKYEHTYTTGTEQDTHEFGNGIYLVSVTNSIIDGVTVDDMTGDSLSIHSAQAHNPDGSNQEGKIYSENILVKNCTFRGARRDNISLIDIDGFTLEDSTIQNGGEGGYIDNYGEVYDWRGVLPRCNIALEAARSYNDDGVFVISQKIENIVIRNNTFSGAWISDINFHTCKNIEVYGNTFTSGLSNYFAQNVSIHDNILVRDNSLSNLNIGIYMKGFVREETGIEENVNYDIYNNKITGFNTGISIGGNNHKIYGNELINCVQKGITILDGDNHQYYNNYIESNIPDSKGYSCPPAGIELTNSSIKNDIIKVDYYGLLFRSLNSSSGNPLIIDNCNFSGGFRNVDIRDSHSITIQNSTTGTIYQTNNTNITLINNN